MNFPHFKENMIYIQAKHSYPVSRSYQLCTAQCHTTKLLRSPKLTKHTWSNRNTRQKLPIKSFCRSFLHLMSTFMVKSASGASMWSFWTSLQTHSLCSTCLSSRIISWALCSSTSRKETTICEQLFANASWWYWRISTTLKSVPPSRSKSTRSLESRAHSRYAALLWHYAALQQACSPSNISVTHSTPILWRWPMTALLRYGWNSQKRLWT